MTSLLFQSSLGPTSNFDAAKQLYIQRSSERLLAGMSGCIELLIRDAKESHRQIAITWLDHFVKAGVQIARNRKQR